jgi:hypothetical protein
MICLFSIDRNAEKLIKAETVKEKIKYKDKIIGLVWFIVAIFLSAVAILVFWT